VLSFLKKIIFYPLLWLRPFIITPLRIISGICFFVSLVSGCTKLVGSTGPSGGNPLGDVFIPITVLFVMSFFLGFLYDSILEFTCPEKYELVLD